ncbi:hypothetical protein N7528_006486 [Penicillium herquei]|nr:hypothetical protein N7528_006486 [Penicillium herquei]
MTTTISGTTAAPLPLTTTFTPPGACLTDLWAAHSSGSTWMNIGPINTTECLPSGWSPTSAFSPGICPSGWTMAASSTGDSEDYVTVGTCCPEYLPSSTDWVFSTRPTGSSEYPWYSTELCQWVPTTTVFYGYTYTTGGSTTSKPGSMTPGGLWNAYGIIVEWQSSDSLYPVTATATATTGATLSTSTSSSTSTSTATSNKSTSSSSGLSTGAKAGIGIGAAAGGILVLVALAFLFLRRRKQSNSSNLTANEKGSNIELPADQPRQYELASSPIYEAQSPLKSVPPSYREPVELDGR